MADEDEVEVGEVSRKEGLSISAPDSRLRSVEGYYQWHCRRLMDEGSPSETSFVGLAVQRSPLVAVIIEGKETRSGNKVSW
jgi:hypothetical protein